MTNPIQLIEEAFQEDIKDMEDYDKELLKLLESRKTLNPWEVNVQARRAIAKFSMKHLEIDGQFLAAFCSGYLYGKQGGTLEKEV